LGRGLWGRKKAEGGTGGVTTEEAWVPSYGREKIHWKKGERERLSR